MKAREGSHRFPGSKNNSAPGGRLAKIKSAPSSCMLKIKSAPTGVWQKITWRPKGYFPVVYRRSIIACCPHSSGVGDCELK